MLTQAFSILIGHFLESRGGRGLWLDALRQFWEVNETYQKKMTY